MRNAEHIKYRRTTIQNRALIDYQIDVVIEKHFPILINRIDKEIKTATNRIIRNNKKLQPSIDQIVLKAKKIKTVEKIREALDY